MNKIGIIDDVGINNWDVLNDYIKKVVDVITSNKDIIRVLHFKAAKAKDESVLKELQGMTAILDYEVGILNTVVNDNVFQTSAGEVPDMDFAAQTHYNTLYGIVVQSHDRLTNGVRLHLISDSVKLLSKNDKDLKSFLIKIENNFDKDTIYVQRGM